MSKSAVSFARRHGCRRTCTVALRPGSRPLEHPTRPVYMSHSEIKFAQFVDYELGAVVNASGRRMFAYRITKLKCDSALATARPRGNITSITVR